MGFLDKIDNVSGSNVIKAEQLVHSLTATKRITIETAVDR